MMIGTNQWREKHGGRVMSQRQRLLTIIATLCLSTTLNAVESKSLVERFTLIGVITSNSLDQNIVVLRDKLKNNTVTLKQGDLIPGLDDGKISSISRSEVMISVRSKFYSLRHTGSSSEENNKDDGYASDGEENFWLDVLLNRSNDQQATYKGSIVDSANFPQNLSIESLNRNYEQEKRHKAGMRIKDETRGEAIDWQNAPQDCFDEECQDDLDFDQMQLENNQDELPQLEDGLSPNHHDNNLDNEISSYQRNVYEESEPQYGASLNSVDEL